MSAYQGLKLAISLAMMAVLLMLGKGRQDFFLTKGQLDTEVEPFIGKRSSARRPVSWGRLGVILGLCIAPATFLFFGMGHLPSRETLIKALLLLPAAVFFAAMNAFNEEMQFRAPFLATLQETIGRDQAIWLTSVFFGLAHYFGGAPSGMLGVLIAGLLGMLFAKSMLESKGILIPWFMHFCQNAVIYSFWAISSI